MAQDSTYQAKNYEAQGGDLWSVGGTLEIAAGGKLTANGVDVTGLLKAVRAQVVTVAAVDTIVTGLATVVAVIATLDSDPVDDPFMVTASIGDQAGSPAAGSFLLKSWKNTGGTDPTPIAATTFGKKVNYIAYGT